MCRDCIELIRNCKERKVSESKGSSARLMREVSLRNFFICIQFASNRVPSSPNGVYIDAFHRVSPNSAIYSGPNFP